MQYRKRAVIAGKYTQSSVRARIEAFFLDNIGKVATREQIMEVATDPKTGRMPENWHQRLSELRTDYGYTILSWRNRGGLRVSEYLMPSTQRRKRAGERVRPTAATWHAVLEKADHRCAWSEGVEICGLAGGDQDPIGGGTVRLTPDHKQPHSINATADPNDPDKWQPLCGRHQVVKKNYWDDETGWLNVYAIVQSASEAEKLRVYEFLRDYFGQSGRLLL
ncbi:Type-2 restriction enzyme KpnI [subsurface metagenome]